MLYRDMLKMGLIFGAKYMYFQMQGTESGEEFCRLQRTQRMSQMTM
ncbi:hypothetical protein PROFUN_15654 [Planoprotostelium fungivorum]|uniref:Uncharacterized protein n=1 Tax=Planoprotostelium fungivorum TaxID=1890364 RepID=A0A2P6MV66_9EUKA|nr:hypothetical protein PROFUN_15654 [Planoprotostelium fungivorum]